MQGMKFNQDGITAILEGRKTQTRRPLKETVHAFKCGKPFYFNLVGTSTELIEIAPKYKIGETVFVVDPDINKHFERCDFDDECDVCNNAEEGSYGVGYCSYDGEVDSYICGKCAKKAIDNMGEEFASIFLKITNIKVERLQDISDEDCEKEGTKYINNGTFNSVPQEAFETQIWNKIPYQAPYDWSSNPYVFVYEFEVVK